ncbi:MAG TPA: tetratricopeptide repeat protein [Thermoanaerobaculia bacterium]|nr:tetratricopeptide repeat protein [Thermoanaerobaculia bacterium]
MDQLSGSLGERSLFEVVERIRVGWRSGTLVVRAGEQTRRFTFLDGDLYLPASHALAREMGKLLAAEDEWLTRTATQQESSASPPHRSRLRELIGRIADLLGQLKDGDFTFEERPAEDPGQLVGPLWSTLLVLEGAVPPVPAEDIADLLGDEDSIVVGRVAHETASRLGVLGAELAGLVQEISTPATLGDLRRRGGSMALGLVYRLRAAGLVAVLAAPDRRQESSKGAVVEPLTAALTDRLSERIAESLRREPIPDEPESHRLAVADLLSRLGSLDHYELLGVTPLAEERQVHEAFERLGRMVHPLNAQRLQWVGREGILKLLFERAAGAYRALSDPARRTEYNREAGIVLGLAVTGERRQKEVDELAQNLYERAREHAEHEDYFLAVELLRQAISHRPRAEYYALLGQIQRRNPKWLREAQDSFRRALQLQPDNVDLRIEMARLQERAGEAEGAKASYRSALERRPEDTAALQALRRLERYATSGAVSHKEGWMARLLAWLRPGSRSR